MNKNWIIHPTILTGQTVDLLPLQKEHFEELCLAATDKELWKHTPKDCSDKEIFENVYSASLIEREKGNEYPFVIYHKPTKKIIGSTRFFEIFPEHRKLEIGWTWIVKEYWGTNVNFECKFLLLSFCFEGILRKDKIQDNGTTRNAAYFSILDDEWEDAKTKLITQLYKQPKASR
ncbi:MAG: GNAT family N-acetyltransferase [Chitinophagaceae bacterium]|nr:GNAT family N-acetyltransferase [Chitinophagaceae bacterium]